MRLRAKFAAKRRSIAAGDGESAALSGPSIDHARDGREQQPVNRDTFITRLGAGVANANKGLTLYHGEGFSFYRMHGFPNNKPLTIGSIAKLAGVPVTTVRFYERADVVRPVSRTVANYRLYSGDAVARIRFTRRAQELGFTVREVKDLLALRSSGGKSCRKARVTAKAKIADIESRIRSLQRMGRALTKLADECETHVRNTGCPLLEYLDDKL